MSETIVRCECAGHALEVTGIDYYAIPDFLQAQHAAGGRVLDLGGDPRLCRQVAIQVVARAEGRVEWELVLAESRPGGLSADTVVCFDDRIAVALSGYVVCIRVPTGDVLWVAEGDDACCFGIHLLASEPALIVHGELEISKLTLDGEIVWRASGNDIFTGPFEIGETGIRAVDFYGTVYWIRLDTGDIEIIGEGKPPWPHDI